MTIAFQLAVFALIATSSILLISVPVVFASPEYSKGRFFFVLVFTFPKENTGIFHYDLDWVFLFLSVSNWDILLIISNKIEIRYLYRIPNIMNMS